MENLKFNNSKNNQLANESSNWTFVAHFGNFSKDARAKCIELVTQGVKAFYKRIIENGNVNYYVYTF